MRRGVQQLKTNAMRLLDRRRIAYSAHEYDPSIRSAAGVADVLGVEAGQVYKTLVMQREAGTPLLVMVPGDREVEPRVLAREVGAQSVQMAPRHEAERLTGLQTGGIGALALLDRPFDVYIDADALARDTIFVNGGSRGLNLRMKVSDLVELTGARPVATATTILSSPTRGTCPLPPLTPQS